MKRKLFNHLLFAIALEALYQQNKKNAPNVGRYEWLKFQWKETGLQAFKMPQFVLDKW